jgi:hypothetical protein
VPIEVMSCPVVTPRASGIGMPGSILHVPQAGSGVETQGHKGVPEVVWVERIGFSRNRLSGQTSQGPPRL